MTETINPRQNSILSLREMIAAAMMAAVTAVCAWITVPATVPFTMHTFAVFCAVLLLGSKGGFFSILTYLLIGAAGVPVFSGFKGGLGVLLGSTGGYLIGFLFMPVICLAAEKLFGAKLIPTIISLVIGLFVCYAFGTAWFIHVSTNAVTLKQALKWCVIPFVIPDLLKLVLAVVLSLRVKKYIKLR